MAGFALIFDSKEQPTVNDPIWVEFHESVAAFKFLDIADVLALGMNCIAAKLDATCSLHRGITRDNKTGSWLLAVGTIIDSVDFSQDGKLDRLLLDYLTQGERILSRLDGQFALIIYNATENRILVISDPFGMIPVYYGQKDQRIYISTSALAVAKAVQSIPNEFGVRSFILYGSTFGDTLWQNVHMLPSASLLNITNQGFRKSIYWSFNVDPGLTKLSLNESVDIMIESLSHSLRQSLTREGKVWISLTGGLDSRTLAALAQFSKIPFKTYCHGPLDSRDVQIAASISQRLGWEHEYFPLPEDWGLQRTNWFDRVLGQTDGLLDVIKMSRTIREQTIKAKQFGVSLWGYGGELYRGVYWKQEFWRTGITSRVDYERLMDYRVIPGDWTILEDGENWKESVRAEIKTRLQIIGEQQPDWPNTIKLDLIGQLLEQHVCGNTIAAVLGQQRVILPYDFKENIAQIFSLNYKWRTHSRMFRLILERINPNLAEMETADGGPASPMRFRNIYQFVPYWMDASEKLLWRLGYKSLGKPLWRRRNAGPAGTAYPIERWLQNTITQLQDQGMVIPDRMNIPGLYTNKLNALFTKPSRSQEGFIGHIIAVQLALNIASMDIKQFTQQSVKYAIPQE